MVRETEADEGPSPALIRSFYHGELKYSRPTRIPRDMESGRRLAVQNVKVGLHEARTA